MWRNPTRTAQLAHACHVSPFAEGIAMFGVGIMAKDRTELISIEGTMTSGKYLRDILYPHVTL